LIIQGEVLLRRISDRANMLIAGVPLAPRACWVKPMPRCASICPWRFFASWCAGPWLPSGAQKLDYIPFWL